MSTEWPPRAHDDQMRVYETLYRLNRRRLARRVAFWLGGFALYCAVLAYLAWRAQVDLIHR